MFGDIDRQVITDKLKAAKESREAILEAAFSEKHRFNGSYLKMVPKVYRWLVYRCFIGEMKGVRLIKAKCLDCAGYQKEEVAFCNVNTCPLWHQRPYQDYVPRRFKNEPE